MKVRELFNNALTYPKHEKGDLHYIGEALPAPSSPATVVNATSTSSPGGSSVPAREDHVHQLELEIDLSNYYTKAEADAIHAGMGGGSSTLAGLTDTTITSPTNKQVLEWDSGTATWIDGLDISAFTTANSSVLNAAATEIYFLGDTWGSFGADFVEIFSTSTILELASTTSLDIIGGTDVDIDAPSVTIDSSTTNIVLTAAAFLNAYAASGMEIAVTGLNNTLSLVSVTGNVNISAGDGAEMIATNQAAISGTKVVLTGKMYSVAHPTVDSIQANVTGTKAIDLEDGARSSFDFTMTSNTTFSITNVPNDYATGETTFTLLLKGAFTPTWPGSVKWSGGSAPSYTTPALYQFKTFDAGTTWYGFQFGSAYA